jgi:hypothetical protein
LLISSYNFFSILRPQLPVIVVVLLLLALLVLLMLRTTTILSLLRMGRFMLRIDLFEPLLAQIYSTIGQLGYVI